MGAHSSCLFSGCNNDCSHETKILMYPIKPDTKWNVFLVIWTPKEEVADSGSVGRWALYIDTSHPRDIRFQSRFSRNQDDSYDFQSFYGLSLHVGSSKELGMTYFAAEYWSGPPKTETEKCWLLGSLTNVFRHKDSSAWCSELISASRSSYFTELQQIFGTPIEYGFKDGVNYYGKWTANFNCHTWTRLFARQCLLEIPSNLCGASQDVYPAATDVILEAQRPSRFVSHSVDLTSPDFKELLSR